MQSEITLKLIAENKVKHAQGEDARVLDLGNCSLSLLPPQVLECFWVEALILSSNWEEYDLENKKWKQLHIVFNVTMKH